MFVSCLVAVRDAVRKAQCEDLLNEYEEDFVSWAYEAEKLILNNTFALGGWKEQKSICLTVQNNQVQLPQDFYSLVCVKVGNKYPTLINTSACRIKRNCNCYNLKYSDLGMIIKGYSITFTPNVTPDGTPVEIQYEALRLESANGYIMVFEDHTTAISEYLQWQMLSMKGNDSKAELKRRDWMRSCPQARARTANITKAEMAAMGITWWL